MNKKILEIFDNTIESIDYILNDDFYQKKGNLKQIRELIKKWFINYKETGTLKNISAEKLEYIDIEITSIFDKYIEIESVENNYVERLLFDFGNLMQFWKNEMLGGKDNVRK